MLHFTTFVIVENWVLKTNHCISTLENNEKRSQVLEFWVPIILVVSLMNDFWLKFPINNVSIYSGFYKNEVFCPFFIYMKGNPSQSMFPSRCTTPIPCNSMIAAPQNIEPQPNQPLALYFFARLMLITCFVLFYVCVSLSVCVCVWVCACKYLSLECFQSVKRPS